VSIDPAGPGDHPARDARALAQGRLSLLLALEVAPTGRATADRHGAARTDPADECRKSALGRAWRLLGPAAPPWFFRHQPSQSDSDGVYGAPPRSHGELNVQ